MADTHTETDKSRKPLYVMMDFLKTAIGLIRRFPNGDLSLYCGGGGDGGGGDGGGSGDGDGGNMNRTQLIDDENVNSSLLTPINGNTNRNDVIT